MEQVALRCGTRVAYAGGLYSLRNDDSPLPLRTRPRRRFSRKSSSLRARRIFLRGNASDHGCSAGPATAKRPGAVRRVTVTVAREVSESCSFASPTPGTSSLCLLRGYSRAVPGREDPSAVTATFHRALPAVPWSVTALRHAVADFVVGAGIGEPALTGIKLVVSEAVTNVVVHAYVGAERPGEVRVRVCVSDEAVLVMVSDDGCGMVPRLDSPGLGVGLPFIAHTADALDIDHNAGGGTELRMTFRIAVRADRS
jgi:anti-sigma regulatory factor (Ser/Thr protein kinase)